MQSVWRLLMSQRSRVRYPVRQLTFVSLSADSKKAVVSYWRMHLYLALVNRLGGPSLPVDNVVRLPDHSDMTKAVYRGCKQRNNNNPNLPVSVFSSC